MIDTPGRRLRPQLPPQRLLLRERELAKLLLSKLSLKSGMSLLLTMIAPLLILQ